METRINIEIGDWVLIQTFAVTVLLVFSSTNAYMLMYRRKDLTRNEMFTDPTKWPVHIKTSSEKLEEEEEEEINKKVKDRSICKVACLFYLL